MSLRGSKRSTRRAREAREFTDGWMGWDGMGWDGTEYQKCPLIFFILCGSASTDFCSIPTMSLRGSKRSTRRARKAREFDGIGSDGKVIKSVLRFSSYFVGIYIMYNMFTYMRNKNCHQYSYGF